MAPLGGTKRQRVGSAEALICNHPSHPATAAADNGTHPATITTRNVISLKVIFASWSASSTVLPGITLASGRRSRTPSLRCRDG